jgi:ubiquinone/menaquinone biosynthesis C-methylase UbiE
MDYDAYEIAAVYDRARALAPETARIWRELVSDYIAPDATSLIVDLGCGTGRFSELLARKFTGQIVGIDPSAKMIEQARRKPGPGNVSYRRGSGEALLLPDDCADLVFMSMVYHHLADPAATARECRRVLRAGAMPAFATAPARGIFHTGISFRCSGSSTASCPRAPTSGRSSREPVSIASRMRSLPR